MIKLSAIKFDAEAILLALLILVAFNFTVTILTGQEEQNQFSHLADAFLSGQLHFRIPPPALDTVDYVPYDGKFYWQEGPFSAVLLMPFVFLFGTNYLTIALLLVLISLTFVITYAIGRRFAFTNKQSAWLAIAYVFSSVFVGVAVIPWPFYLAQVLGSFLLLLAIHEFFYRQRWLLIGTLVGVAIFSRYSLIIAAIFFLFHLIAEVKQKKWSSTLRSLCLFLLPIAVVGGIIMTYNNVRFGSPFQTGYMLTNKGDDIFRRDQYGLFKFENIPTNIYYYFLKSPDPVLNAPTSHLVPPYFSVDTRGLNFFIVSPIFFLVFFVRPEKRERLLRWSLWTVSGVQLLLLLSYFSPGYSQFLGPRFMLDLLPWLFILLLLYFRQHGLSIASKSMIVASMVVNFYLMFATIIIKTGS